MQIAFYSLLITLEIIGIYAALHSLLNKKNAGAAFSWILVNLFLPVIGPALYYLFGINRIHRKAYLLRGNQPHSQTALTNTTLGHSETVAGSQFYSLAKLSAALSGQPLLGANKIELLENGETTYARMLHDIKQAKEHIYLSTYIFDTDLVGREFIDALADAHTKGIRVKVLIDSYGESMQIPWASSLLKLKGVDAKCFLPIFPIPRINLRNHKKILLVDGHTAYTGGMNISARHLVNNNNSNRVIDTHFKLRGPIIKQIESEFISDWLYVSNEILPLTNTTATYEGNSICRVLSDGPDNDVDIFIETLVTAFAAAQHSIYIMTPYFIPTPEITNSLKMAATRGVDVIIVLSEKTDLPYINWASSNILDSFLNNGVSIYFQPPPFVHAKLVLVDKHYTQIGSVNIDPRSLKLNFELAVEAYDDELACVIMKYFNNAISHSKKLTLDEINKRSLIIKIRDAFAWLFSPYL